MKPQIPFHPYANLFPLIEGKDFADLVEDIRQNGVRVKGRLYHGQILDGRNRYAAAALANVDMEFEEFKGDDDAAVSYVLSTNLHRRHLSESQRALIGADLEELRGRGRPQGGNSESIPNYEGPPPLKGGLRQNEVARKVGVSTRLITAAKVVKERAVPEVRKAVERGMLPVMAAEKAARLEPEKQREIAARASEGKSNVVNTVIKKAARAEKETALAVKQKALPDQKFGVIYADPEWRFEPRSRETGMDRAPENHYPTSTTDEIAARPVATIAADDCVLFLWGTAPMIEAAHHVMREWGFEYKSQMIWRKVRSGKARGPGYWFTGGHEHLLVGTKGKIPAPAPGTQWESVIDAPVGEHSEKPAIFAEMIEQYFPNLPKIELNARVVRKGWTVWGLEAPDADNQDIHVPVEDENQDAPQDAPGERAVSR